MVRSKPRSDRAVVITSDEWLGELFRLQAASECDDGFLSTQEIAARTGRCTDAVLMSLRKAKASGRLQVRTVKRSDISGRLSPIPVYRVLEQ